MALFLGGRRAFGAGLEWDSNSRQGAMIDVISEVNMAPELSARHD